MFADSSCLIDLSWVIDVCVLIRNRCYVLMFGGCIENSFINLNPVIFIRIHYHHQPIAVHGWT